MRYVLPVLFWHNSGRRDLSYTSRRFERSIRCKSCKDLLKKIHVSADVPFGKNSMPDVDNLLTSFYQLDDEARQEVVETIRLKLQYHRDPERAEQIKQIKGW